MSSLAWFMLGFVTSNLICTGLLVKWERQGKYGRLNRE